MTGFSARPDSSSCHKVFVPVILGGVGKRAGGMSRCTFVGRGGSGKGARSCGMSGLPV